jgi:hypothetical protein
VKVWFAGVTKEIDMAVKNRFPLKKAGENIEFCQTQSSMFVIDKTKNFAYGFNYAVHEGSSVMVPLVAGEETMSNSDLKIEKIVCSQNNQYFQLIVNDLKNKKKYLNTYFSFDGTQAGKKLHSQILLDNSVTDVLTTSLQFSYRVRILTIVSPDSKFMLAPADDKSARKVYQINLNGPEFYVCLNKYFFSLNFDREIKPLLVNWYRDEKEFDDSKLQQEIKKQKHLYTSNPNYWYRGDNYPNRIKLEF